MIGIIGLGYVGFPLAVEFSKILPVTGFDINKSRVLDLKNGIDKTLEVLINLSFIEFNQPMIFILSNFFLLYYLILF